MGRFKSQRKNEKRFQVKIAKKKIMKLFKRKPEAMEVDQEELLNEIEQAGSSVLAQKNLDSSTTTKEKRKKPLKRIKSKKEKHSKKLKKSGEKQEDDEITLISLLDDSHQLDGKSTPVNEEKLDQIEGENSNKEPASAKIRRFNENRLRKNELSLLEIPKIKAKKTSKVAKSMVQLTKKKARKLMRNFKREKRQSERIQNAMEQ